MFTYSKLLPGGFAFRDRGAFAVFLAFIGLFVVLFAGMFRLAWLSLVWVVKATVLFYGWLTVGVVALVRTVQARRQAV